MTTSRNDFPAVNGRVVTQGHADICNKFGHAVQMIDGIPQMFCPRCGDAR